MNDYLQWYVIIAACWAAGYVFEAAIGVRTLGFKDVVAVVFWPLFIIAIVLVLLALPVAFVLDHQEATKQRKRP